MKNMKQTVIAIVAAMMMVGAGSAAWACGSYGDISPEQQEQNFVMMLEMQLKYQQQAFDTAMKESNYTLAQTIYDRILTIETNLQDSKERLAQMQNADQEVASVK